MASHNQASIIGNLGRKPELRKAGGAGTSVTMLDVATTRAFMQGTEKIEETEWHQCVVWGKMAEACCKYLDKGRQVFVQGRLATRSYTKDGQKHWTTEIIAERVQFLGGAPQSKPTEPSPAELAETFPPEPSTTDEIPF